MSALLEVENLRVTYGGVVAVRDVSLSVAPGEVVAVLGANDSDTSRTATTPPYVTRRLSISSSGALMPGSRGRRS